MSTFWENGAKYQECKNKGKARKPVILLFLFFYTKTNAVILHLDSCCLGTQSCETVLRGDYTK